MYHLKSIVKSSSQMVYLPRSTQTWSSVAGAIKAAKCSAIPITSLCIVGCMPVRPNGLKRGQYHDFNKKVTIYKLLCTYYWWQYTKTVTQVLKKTKYQNCSQFNILKLWYSQLATCFLSKHGVQSIFSDNRTTKY